MSRKIFLSLSSLLSLLMAQSAFATNGYLMTGSGYKVGTGGAGVAVPLDGTDCALNPALLADMQNNIIGSLGVFHPAMRMDTSGATPPPLAGNLQTQGWAKSKKSNFPDGGMGYRQGYNETWAFGISLTGSGGMVTDYPFSRTNPAFQQTPISDTGVFYRMAFVSPAVAMKATNNVSLGVSAIIGYSDFKTDTVVAPTPPAVLFPRTVGNNERERAWGLGLRLGAKIDVTKEWSLALSGATPILFQRFDKYPDALISAFNFPANMTAGLSYKVLPCTQLMADYKFVYYQGTRLLKNTPENGGFGWKNQHIFMIGALHKFNELWDGRIGYNYGKSPIKNDRVFANVIAPAIVEHHIAAGLTYKPVKCHEISLNGYFVPRKTQTESGTGDMFSRAGKGTKISMWQYGLQVAWKYNF